MNIILSPVVVKGLLSGTCCILYLGFIEMRGKQSRKHNTANAVSHGSHYFYWGSLEISEVADVALPCCIPW